MRVVPADVELARTAVEPHVRRTPLMRTVLETAHGPLDVALKFEHTQLGGSFKVRGSLWATLHAQAHGTLTDAGIVVASGGNAAIGAAHAARITGVRCSVVVPETAPEIKVDTLRTLGATVHLAGRHYRQAAEEAARLAAESGALELHAYDLPAVVAGAGTIGLEIAEDLPGPLTTVACVGGGGLLAGLAAVLRPGDRLVGVEPTGASCLHQALTAGTPVDVELDSVAVDSLGATRIGDLCWEAVAGNSAVESVLVTDEQIVAARTTLWNSHRILVEHGTAAAVGAVLTGAVQPEPNSTLCIVLCGANTALSAKG